jgi:hypothetical protein
MSPGENGSKGIGTENGKMERLVKMVTVKQMKIIKTKELSKVFLISFFYELDSHN